MNISSVLTSELVGEAKVWYSVWLFIDSFNLFVYAATAEKEIGSAALTFYSCLFVAECFDMLVS